MDRTLLDLLPLWMLCVLTVLTVAASIEIGYRLGQFRRHRAPDEKESSAGTIVGATLGLLAFMLAFTFGLAATRFDARRMVVLDEANAIGTTYLRAGMLPEPQSGECRRLLRAYTEVRLRAVESGTVELALADSAQLHGKLWEQATQLAHADSHSIVLGLFVESLNNVIDLHSRRVMFALRNRIPQAVWLALFFITYLSMGSLGYLEGLAHSRRSLTVWSLLLTFSAVILLIADLDRTGEGLLRVSQQAMYDVLETMAPAGK